MILESVLCVRSIEQSPVIVLTYLTGMCVENRTDAKEKRNACAFSAAKGGMVRSDFVALCPQTQIQI